MMTTTTPEITFDDLRGKINKLAADRGEWAGYPMPIQGLKLVVEPRHPMPSLNGAWMGPNDDDHARRLERIANLPNDYVERNHFYCFKRRVEVWVCTEADGRVKHYTLPLEWGGVDGLINQFAVASQAWSAEAESHAQNKLAAIVTDVAFKHYSLIGMFLETSKRSGVTYMFRKLAPTIAMKAGLDGAMRALTTLCLHPIGHYEQTPCGVMVPTDDVIAHVLMMRGDEHKFWAKANHHPAWTKAARIA